MTALDGQSRSQPTIWHIGGDDISLRLAQFLKLKELGCHVVAVGSEDGKELKAHGIPYLRYPLSRHFSPVSDLNSQHFLLRLFSQHRPDVVHAFHTKPSIFAMFAAQRAGVPVRIRTVTGMGFIFSERSLRALRAAAGLPGSSAEGVAGRDLDGVSE